MRLELFRLEDLREDDRLRGTFAPDLRASDRPMAMACLRLVALRPERPLFNVPLLRSRMALPTFFDALLLYFGIVAPFGDPFTASEAPSQPMSRGCRPRRNDASPSNFMDHSLLHLTSLPCEM